MLAAIVDDAPQDAKRLETYFRRYAEEAGGEYSTVVYPSAAALLADQDAAFDLIIMDIDMPGINGVDAARELRERDDRTVLMFVTNMPQYALAGYEVEAMDYVLKPVSYQEFALKLRKAQRYILRSRDEQVALRTPAGVMALSVSEILYVESSLHYLTYHLTGRDIRVRGTMSDAEALLPAKQFARCNSGYLVNLRHVEAIDKEDVLVGGQRLKISRGKRLDFMDRFTRYLGGMT